MISFSQYVAELLQQTQDGMITEAEMARKINHAAWTGMSGVKHPEHNPEDVAAKVALQLAK